MTAWTATHLDLALCGISAAAMVPDARAVAATYPSVGQGTIFELPGHGFAGVAALAGPERVRLAGGNINGVVLDTAISPTLYYVANVASGDPDFFTLSTLGAPLVLNGDGVGLPSALENIIPKIDLIMARWTSVLISSAIAYSGQWSTPPAWAPLLVATLAAPTVAEVLRVARARFDVTSLTTNTPWATTRLAALEGGATFSDGIGPVDSDTIANDPMRAKNRQTSSGCAPTRWQRGTL